MDIAIIGVAGKFPQANNLDELLEVLTSGKDCVRPIDADRLSKTTIQTDLNYIDMAYLNDVDLFDYKYFNYPKSEANKMAPQHRLALEIVHHALEDTGYHLSHFDGSRTSVYCGTPKISYEEHWETDLDPTGIMGASQPFLSARISRIFNLRGNSLVLDTTCSSSLVALHTAVNDLKCGDSDYAIVLGVNVEDFPIEKEVHIANEELGVNILSSSFKAKAFSDLADGTGVGEAVVAFVLKPLTEAIKDNDNIHAVIKSTAVNQDAGMSASPTAPDSQAQSEVILEAWKKAKINPEDIGYIEAHGTGTKLGDPIEIEGIRLAFKEFTAKKNFCSISSIKTNFGHTDSAAGLVGLTKVILSLKHKLKFENVHFERPNPFINFEETPLYVQQKTEDWTVEKNKKRLAGVSAFGLTGTNCHVVLEEYVNEDDNSSQPDEKLYLIPISSKSSNGFKRNALTLKHYLQLHNELPIRNIAAVLSRGRVHHAFRDLLKARSVKELIQELDAIEIVEMEKIEKSILIFSHLELTEHEWNNWIDSTPILNDEIEKLRLENSLNLHTFSSKERVIVFQLAMFNTLKKCGIHSELLMGDGVGKLSIQIIKGDISILEGITKANETNSDQENFSVRIKNFIDSQTKNERVAFLEMGSLGSISNEILNNIGNFELIALELKTGLFQMIRKAYHIGIDLNWELWLSTDLKKISLPGYAFEPTRCWLKEPFPIFEKNSLTSDILIHSSKWIEVNRSLSASIDDGIVLVAIYNSNHKEYFKNWFLNQKCVFISLNCESLESAQDILQIDNKNTLVDYMHQLDYVPSLFIDASLFLNRSLSIKESIQNQFLWVKELNKCKLSKSFTFIALSTDGYSIKEGETVNPLVYASTAFCKALQKDLPVWNVKCIDLSSSDDLNKLNLHSEITSESGKKIAAIRGNQIYEQKLDSKSFNHLNYSPYKNGAYVITGGASGIGKQIAFRIARQIKEGKLFLIGRTSKSDRQAVIEELSKINSNVEINYERLDVTDKNSVNKFFETLSLQGILKLEAIIHAAGIGMSGTSIVQESESSFIEIMTPKTIGLLNIVDAAKNIKSDRMFLFSSLNAVLPYSGSASYAVGNAFMDGYAESVENVLSIGWPGWQGIGMSAESTDYDYLLTDDEFFNVFERLINAPTGHFLVTKGDLTPFENNPFAHLDSLKIKKVEENLPTREFIHQLWIKILEEPSVGLDDDFFDLGGHSLIGAQMVNILKTKYLVNLAFEDIYEYATVNQLTNYIETNSKLSLIDEVPEKITSAKVGQYPLTAAQQGIWIVSQMEDRKSDFNMPGLVELRGELDILALEKALLLLIKKHEPLRTLFIEVEGEIVQSVVDTNEVLNPIKIQHADFTNLEESIESHKKNSLEYAFKPFNLESEFPIRLQLLTDYKDHHLLVFVTHHIVSDGVSIDILTSEFFNNYTKLVENPNYEVEDLHENYGEFAKEQVNYYSSNEYENDKKYWIDTLIGKMSRLKLPYDQTLTETNEKKAQSVEINLTEQDVKSFEKMREELKVSPFVLFISLVKLLLFKYNGDGPITLGFPYHGRDNVQYQNHIGLFVNLLAIHSEINGEISFNQFVNTIKETYLKTLKHKKFPFEHLVKLVNNSGQKFEDSIYDVSVNYWQDQQDLFMSDNYMAINKNLDRKVHSFSDSSAQRNIAFEFLGGNVTKAIIKYDKNVFKEITIELMAERFLQLLRNVAINNNNQIKKIDFNPTWKSAASEANVFNENLEENF